jgi:hypothetical protein
MSLQEELRRDAKHVALKLHVIVQEEEPDEEDAAAEAEAEEQRQAEMDEAAEEDDKDFLHPQDIDAYWLQRRIAATFTDIDATRSQKLADDVLGALAVSTIIPLMYSSRSYCSNLSHTVLHWDSSHIEQTGKLGFLEALKRLR